MRKAMIGHRRRGVHARRAGAADPIDYTERCG